MANIIHVNSIIWSIMDGLGYTEKHQTFPTIHLTWNWDRAKKKIALEVSHFMGRLSIPLVRNIADRIIAEQTGIQPKNNTTQTGEQAPETIEQAQETGDKSAGNRVIIDAIPVLPVQSETNFVAKKSTQQEAGKMVVPKRARKVGTGTPQAVSSPMISRKVVANGDMRDAEHPSIEVQR